MKAKFIVDASIIDCTVYTNGQKIILKAASQKDLEFLFKKNYKGITAAKEVIEE